MGAVALHGRACRLHPHPCTFIGLQRRLCQRLAQALVLRAHHVLRLQVEHGLGVRGDGVCRRLQFSALDLDLHLRGHVHALLVHGAAVERGRLLVLLQLLRELVASGTNQTQQSDAGPRPRRRHQLCVVCSVVRL